MQQQKSDEQQMTKTTLYFAMHYNKVVDNKQVFYWIISKIIIHADCMPAKCNCPLVFLLDFIFHLSPNHLATIDNIKCYNKGK
jgi:hypothetical protein